MENLTKRKNLLAKVFFALIIAFIVSVSFIFVPMPESVRSSFFPVFATLASIAFVFGIALIFLTLKSKLKGLLKVFFLITGISVVGMPVSILLHNLIYGLFIYMLGQDFWERIGLGDEPVFFIIAVIVCPLGFLAGAIGSIILLAKQRKSN